MSSLSKIKLNEAIEKIKLHFKETRTERVKTFLGKNADIEYIYERIIGRGTFGVVVSIRTLLNNEKMALKRVYQDKKYYNRELEILLQLDHSNIIKLNYFNFAEKTEYGCYLNLFFELGDVSFEQLITAKRKFTEEEVLSFFVQCLSALRCLEMRNIAHRDIKPANLILVGEKAVKICDFGSAKKLTKDDYNSTYICSRYYRAPENVLGLKDYDTKIDVWAIGLSLLELFTFSPVFSGESNSDQLKQVLKVVKISEKFRKDHVLNTKGALGIENYLEPIVTDKKLAFLFENTIVFDKEERWSASELFSWAQKPEI